ncbi:MAG: hypothetical protein ABID63_14990 [Pseudomonadota bacterium]
MKLFLLAPLALTLTCAAMSAQACQTGYYRFVDTGTGSPWNIENRAYYDDQDAANGVSVFVDLAPATYKTMANDRQSGFGADTSVFMVPCSAVVSPLTATQDGKKYEVGSWIYPSGGKSPTHAMITAPNYPAASAPLAAQSTMVFSN